MEKETSLFKFRNGSGSNGFNIVIERPKSVSEKDMQKLAQIIKNRNTLIVNTESLGENVQKQTIGDYLDGVIYGLNGGSMPDSHSYHISKDVCIYSSENVSGNFEVKEGTAQ